jgi:Predicted membrane protein
VVVFTLGLFTPVAVWLYKRECLNHLYLGQLKFNLNNTWGDYMRAMYVPLFLFMGFGALLAVIFAILFGSSDGLNDASYVFIIFGMYLIGYMFIWPLTAARIFITTWNNTTLSRSQFHTDCNQWRYAWIVLSNWLAKVISLGLLTPWAVVRLYKYQTESLHLMLVDDPDQLQNQMQQDHNAIAEELSDIFDLDISL